MRVQIDAFGQQRHESAQVCTWLCEDIVAGGVESDAAKSSSRKR